MNLIEKIENIQKQIDSLEAYIEGINDSLGLKYYDVHLSGLVITYSIQIFEINKKEENNLILSFDVNYDEILFKCKLKDELIAEENRVINNPLKLQEWRKIMNMFGNIEC